VLLEPLPGQSRSGWRAGFVGERGLRARPLISEGTGKAPVAAVADVHGLESLPQCAHDSHRNRTRRQFAVPAHQGHKGASLIVLTCWFAACRE
jgi:hypothetical protein